MPTSDISSGMRGHWLLLLVCSTASIGCSSQAKGPAESGGGGQPSAGDLGDAGALAAAGQPGAAGESGTPAPELGDGPGQLSIDFASSPDFVALTAGLGMGLRESPHQLVQIFYSANIAPILLTGSFGPLPEGTVAAKLQSRDGDEAVDQVMLMVKKAPGTDPERGDWVWEQRRPETLELVSSSETSASFRDFCSGCHGRYTFTDWLAGTSLADRTRP